MFLVPWIACVGTSTWGDTAVATTEGASLRRPSPPNAWWPEVEVDTDVVVIGAGPAGLLAAGDLAEAGLDVVVLEGSDAVGGSARWWEQPPHLLFAGTPLQAAAGIDDGPETLLADWAELADGSAEDPWVQRFATDQQALYAALVDELGWSFSGPRRDDDFGGLARLHDLDGESEELIADLVARVPEIVVDAWVQDLAWDEGAVAIEVADGERWRARAVLVATGGFLRDRGWLKAAGVDPDVVRWSTAPTSLAGGHSVLDGLGADMGELVVGAYSHGVADPWCGTEELVIGPTAAMIWVGPDGQRYADESHANSLEAGRALLELEDSEAWAIVGNSGDGLTMSDPYTLPHEVHDGDAVGLLDTSGEHLCADDPWMLADAIGVDADGLWASIEAFNAAVDAGGGDAFRDESGLVGPIEHSLYCGFRLRPALAKSFGGVVTDLGGRVLADGEPLPGLYAAGELTGMAGGGLGGHGFNGSLTAVLVSARVAAEGIASDLAR